jgi:hypothetical protein
MGSEHRKADSMMVEAAIAMIGITLATLLVYWLALRYFPKR